MAVINQGGRKYVIWNGTEWDCGSPWPEGYPFCWGAGHEDVEPCAYVIMDTKLGKDRSSPPIGYCAKCASHASEWFEVMHGLSNIVPFDAMYPS